MSERVAALRSDLTALSGMLAEAHAEYTSKTRLRDIAVAVTSAMIVQYDEAVQRVEDEMEREANASGLLVAPTGILSP